MTNFEKLTTVVFALSFNGNVSVRKRGNLVVVEVENISPKPIENAGTDLEDASATALRDIRLLARDAEREAKERAAAVELVYGPTS